MERFNQRPYDFIKKHLRKNNQKRKVVMLLDYKVYLMSVVDLLTPPSIERIGKLVSLNHKDPADGVDISKIVHCDGLLLCITKDIPNHRLVVWNPYSGQTRWIEPRDSYNRFDGYDLGYSSEKNNNCSLLRSHKVLRFVDFFDRSLKRHVREFELYSFNSNSWKKVVDVYYPDWWNIGFYQRGVSLKGNTYWYGHKTLFCFDFTKERFEPRLPLPFQSYGDIVSLASVREEQLAVLFQKQGLPPYTVKIWISSKIEPNAVSWTKQLFLSVDMGFLFPYTGGSFFVDEEQEVALVLDKARGQFRPTHNIAYIISKSGHYKQVDLEEGAEPTDKYLHPLVFSYVPSPVEIM